MKTYPVRSFAIALACFVLTACTDSSITEVKESSVPQSDFTFGEVFDDAKGCKSTKWRTAEDANGRPLVEYTCTAEVSDEMLQKAREANIKKVNDLSAAQVAGWDETRGDIERRIKNLISYQHQERAEGEREIKELEQSIRQEQTRMDQLAAMPVPVLNSPALAAVAEQRRAIDAQEMGKSLAFLRGKVESIQRKLEGPATVDHYKISEGDMTLGEHQEALVKMDAQKEGYFAAINALESSLIGNAEGYAHEQAKRNLQLKVTFRVNKKSPVELTSAAWFLDDQAESGMGMINLAAALIRPSYMPEIIETKWKEKLAMPRDRWKTQGEFPYQCDRAGCELRKPAG